MSGFNGSGTFVISGVGLPYVTGTTISSTVANQLNTDLATGLSTCLTKDGQTSPTGNIPLGGFKITGLGVATTSGDALSYAQAATVSTLISTGLVDISGASAGQVKFPATQNASANANTLDDYEEGTFTPGMTFGGGNTGLTVSAAVGFYTKIGDRVNFDLNIVLTARGSSTGNVSITNLPFSASATSNRLQTPTIWHSATSITLGAAIVGIHTGTSITLYQTGLSGATTAQITQGNLADTAQFVISGQYGV